MAEYIERDALIDALRKYQYPYGVEFLVSCQPAADVVEVVRCKDCKHRDAIFVCAQFDAEVGANHFCSLGERRGDG